MPLKAKLILYLLVLCVTKTIKINQYFKCTEKAINKVFINIVKLANILMSDYCECTNSKHFYMYYGI